MIAVGLMLVHQDITGSNLLANSSLVRGWDGWAAVWSRKEAAATAQITPGRSTANAILVKHSDDQDWAISQVAQVPVKSKQIYELSGWMKVESGTTSISLVTRDAKGSTLDWEIGKVGPSKPGWQLVHRLVVVPTKCQSIQFRFVGYGKGQAWLEAPSLVLRGTVPSLKSKSVQLSASNLKLDIRSDGSMTSTPSMGKAWIYRAWPDDTIIESITALDKTHATIKALQLSDDQNLQVSVVLNTHTSDVTMTFDSKGPMSQPLTSMGSVVTEHGQWVVLPMNEGIRFPVEDMTINNWSLITYGGHGLCMPWSGVYDPKTGDGMMTIIETPDDADMLFQSQEGKLSFQPRWEASRQNFGYTRRLRLSYFPSGGFVAMAKRYRTYAKEIGLFKTLATKRASNPNVDKLVGAVNIWNWDMDKVALCKEMKQMGFDRVLWSGDGTKEQIRTIADLGYLPGRYDIFQGVWDPKHSLSWQITEGWPDDLVWEPSGDWMKGWAHPDKHADGSITWYQGGVINSGAGLKRAKEKIPANLAEVPFQARFINTTTASPFREDYNPLHPLTRSQDRANKMALLDFCSNQLKLVTGTETGIDPSVPVVDYYEGMMSLGPFRLPGAGEFMMEYRKPTLEFLKFQVGPVYRIPLWELVYHDCTVAQWYWGDATNKAPEVWNQRDLLNILYGTAPLLMFDKKKWQHDKKRMLQTYRNVCEWTRKIGYDEMISHLDLTPDHQVQMTTWSSGRSVIVNFSDKAFQGVGPTSFAFSMGK